MDNNQGSTASSLIVQPDGTRPQGPSNPPISQSGMPNVPNTSPTVPVLVDPTAEVTTGGPSTVPQAPTPATDPHSVPSSLSTQNDGEDPHSHNRILADYAHLHSEYKRLYYDYKAKEQQLIARDQTIAAQVMAIAQRDSSLASRTQELLALEKKHTDVRGSWNEYREANIAYQAEFGRKNQEIAELKQMVAQQKSLADKNWSDAVMYKQYMEAAEQKKNTLQTENERLLNELNQAKYDVVQQKNLVTSWSTQGGANYQKLTKSIEVSIEKHFETNYRRWQEAFVQQYSGQARLGSQPNLHSAQQGTNAPPHPNGSHPSSSNSGQAQQSMSQPNPNTQAGPNRRATLPATAESPLPSLVASLNTHSKTPSPQLSLGRPRQKPTPMALDELSAGAFAAAQEAILEPSRSPNFSVPAPQQLSQQRPSAAVMTPIQMHSQTPTLTTPSITSTASHIRATPAPSWTVLPDATEPSLSAATHNTNATNQPPGRRRVSVTNQSGIANAQSPSSPQTSRFASGSIQVSAAGTRVFSSPRPIKTERQDSDSEPDMPLSKRPRTSASGGSSSVSSSIETNSAPQATVISSALRIIVPAHPVVPPVVIEAPAPAAESTQTVIAATPSQDEEARMQVEPSSTPVVLVVQGSDSREPTDSSVPPVESIRAASIFERPSSSMSMSPAVDTVSLHTMPTIAEVPETAASHDSLMVESRPSVLLPQPVEGTSAPDPTPNAMPIVTAALVKPDPDADPISSGSGATLSLSPHTDVDDEESDIDAILDFLAMSFTYREGDDRVVCTLCSSSDAPDGLLVQLSSESDVKYLVEHCRVKHPAETAAALGPPSL